jgi:translation initiation factor IF-3
VLSNAEAKRMAQDKGLDLIEISPNSNPPVCRIADYGKFNYERQKKEKEAKKNQVVMSVKEVRFNPNTDKHDIEFKTKHLHQFLMDGHKVKACVMFKGRMITHPEFGRKLMDEIIAQLSDVGKLEAPPKMEGKQLIAFFIPDKAKIAALIKFRQREAKLIAKENAADAEKSAPKEKVTEEVKTDESQIQEKQTETTDINNNSEGNNTNA